MANRKARKKKKHRSEVKEIKEKKKKKTPEQIKEQVVILQEPIDLTQLFQNYNCTQIGYEINGNTLYFSKKHEQNKNECWFLIKNRIGVESIYDADGQLGSWFFRYKRDIVTFLIEFEKIEERGFQIIQHPCEIKEKFEEAFGIKIWNELHYRFSEIVFDSDIMTKIFCHYEFHGLFFYIILFEKKIHL